MVSYILPSYITQLIIFSLGLTHPSMIHAQIILLSTISFRHDIIVVHVSYIVFTNAD